MKRFLKIGVAVAAICLALCFVACKDVDDESDEIQSLVDAISTAKDGAEIDFGKTNYSVKENDSYTITKKLTITGGDVKNAKFVVKANGVTFSNLKNIDTIIVDELVGDGDFKMENCGKAKTVYVNGGGENSVAIAGTEITNLSVNKSKVHIILGNAAKVTTVYVLKDCNLDSKDKTNTIDGCIVSENVSELTLTGTATIDKLVSAATSSSKIKIAIVKTSTDAFKIMAADNIIKTAVGNAVTISGEVAENDKTTLKAELEKYREEYPTVNDGNSDNSGNGNNNGNDDNSGSEDNSGDDNNNGNSDNDSNVDNNDDSNSNDNSDNGDDVPNTPKLPVSVGTNEVAGRKLTQTYSDSYETRTTVFEVDKDKITFTDKRTCPYEPEKNFNDENTYSYSVKAPEKLIYVLPLMINGMSFEQYCEYIDKYDKNEWLKGIEESYKLAQQEDGYSGTMDEYKKEVAEKAGLKSVDELFDYAKNVIKLEMKKVYESITFYKYTLGADGIIATIEETCDLSVQDWKTLSNLKYSEYEGNNYINISPEQYVYNYYSSTSGSRLDYYIYYEQDNVIGKDNGTITYKFYGDRDRSDPKLTDEQKAVYLNAWPNTMIFSYEVNKETVTYTDENGSYILELKTETYTDDSVKAQ